MSYVKLLNNMTWSFSRLHAYEQCPYQFYLTYIEERDGESNFYAENGLCMHRTFEAILSSEIPIDDCTKFYGDQYDLICERERQSVMDSTYEKCMDYLSVVDDIRRDKYEILGIELLLEFKIGKYKFKGIADLVVRDRDTGKVILVDHKQATHFLKKDGTPLKNQQENFFAYRHQMYLYCIGLKEQLGIGVDTIVWHHFKDDGALTVISFSNEELEETKQWAIGLIETIKKDKEFCDKKSYLLCAHLCNYRNDCEYKDLEE